ncbi:uncharacterized protein LOC123506441 [Portunus trituberculatus]|uniref:uncharacterized protein LOC123506441 n=1 Tax=Portunus trituberculatus TaxID=210409 RepID=UPI001E1CB951|nr:uncharacterized protein LOC123506441 [Portunus trituberculatus]
MTCTASLTISYTQPLSGIHSGNILHPATLRDTLRQYPTPSHSQGYTQAISYTQPLSGIHSGNILHPATLRDTLRQYPTPSHSQGYTQAIFYLLCCNSLLTQQ